jgi:HD-GYP domain-containing protein (c-di-GMP phosphodiesterase class II)
VLLVGVDVGSSNRLTAARALVLGDVVDADDGYTGEHSRGVVALALEVGERLGLDATQLPNLEFGALLHDVGKVAIPQEIINKPGSLDPAEWTIIKTPIRSRDSGCSTASAVSCGTSV